MAKIIYINYQPITNQLITTFFMKEMLMSGHEVEYFDLSSIFFPSLDLHEENGKVINVIKIYNYFQLNELVKINKNTSENIVYLLMITYSYKVIRLFRILTKHKCKTAIFARGTIPNWNKNEVNSTSFLLLVLKSKITFPKIWNSFAYLLKYFQIIKSYDTVFSAGYYGFYTIGVGNDLDKKISKIVKINSIDFDNRIIGNSEKIEQEKIIVFLDEYLPHHPDFDLLKLKKVASGSYYDSLNSFFDLVEAYYNAEVVICAHPKAVSYAAVNPFRNRKIYYNQTNRVVAKSKLVIAHCSTSISYAVIYNKPVIFVYTNAIKSIMPYTLKYINYFNDHLAGHLFNIDEDHIVNIPLKVNISAYTEYKYNFLTNKESENSTTVGIVLNYLSNG